MTFMTFSSLEIPKKWHSLKFPMIVGNASDACLLNNPMKAFFSLSYIPLALPLIKTKAKSQVVRSNITLPASLAPA